MGLENRFYALGLLLSHCPAPSIGDSDGNKRADCLSPLKGGRVSACSGRNGDAQDKAGHGRALLLRFLARDRK
jgi:hypothetical protein